MWTHSENASRPVSAATIACVLAICVWQTWPGDKSALAAPRESGARLVNRTVLSVASDTYTAWDAAATLCAWNAVAAPEVALSLRWVEHGVFGPRARGGDETRSLPEEARRFLFLALVWNESRKLNLFVPPEKELGEAVQSLLSNKSGCVVTGGGAEAQDFLTNLPAARWRTYADMAMRAKTFERVRGSFDRNASLLAQTWFWHATSEGGN